MLRRILLIELGQIRKHLTAVLSEIKLIKREECGSPDYRR